MITTEGKTLQQVSDELAETLINQGERCVGVVGCVYGNGRGQHCAVGWLLPEDPELMQFKGPLHDLIVEQTGLGPNESFLKKNVKFLDYIQSLHDAKTKRYRKRIVGRVSEEFDLDMTAWQPWVDMGVKNGTD